MHRDVKINVKMTKIKSNSFPLGHLKLRKFAGTGGSGL
jgi:hypothetical protein